MKNKIIANFGWGLVVAIACTFLDACGKESPVANNTSNVAKSGSEFNRWQIESAKIEFIYSGAFKGKETFHLDDWGDTVVMEIDRTEFGNPLRQTTIWNNNKTTIYKHDDKKAWQGIMRVRDSEPSAFSRLSEAELKSVGYERLPDEEIAGKKCAVYDNKSLKMKFWMWNGIELKVINHSLGDGYTKEAVSVQVGVKVPESILGLPAGYQFDE